MTEEPLEKIVERHSSGHLTEEPEDPRDVEGHSFKGGRVTEEPNPDKPDGVEGWRGT